MKEFVQYSSSTGLSTRHWGPKGWYFLFSCIMSYPIKIDKGNPEHRIIRKHFKNMLLSLSYTMPCIFCRNSYRQFVKELPINPFLKGRIRLMAWLYLIRDKVNKKLIKQENECYDKEFALLTEKLQNGEISSREFNNIIELKKQEIFITKPSPSFKSVLDMYESIRADCLPSSKTCSIKK